MERILVVVFIMAWLALLAFMAYRHFKKTKSQQPKVKLPSSAKGVEKTNGFSVAVDGKRNLVINLNYQQLKNQVIMRFDDENLQVELIDGTLDETNDQDTSEDELIGNQERLSSGTSAFAQALKEAEKGEPKTL